MHTVSPFKSSPPSLWSVIGSKMALSFVMLLMLSSPCLAQAYGGESETIFNLAGAESGDSLGFSVSAAGDVNADGFDDFIVGAPYTELPLMPGMGSAYVFSGLDGSQLYEWSGTDQNNFFGSSVSDAGDTNSDGYDDVIVGCPGNVVNGVIGAGSAFLFSGADGSILYQWDGIGYYQNFATAVSGAGDVNGDGFADVIVSDPRADFIGRQDAGAAHVFSGLDGSLLFLFEGWWQDDEFGSSVSGAGDVNADGYDDVIVGAIYSDRGGLTDSGSAYVHSGADGSVLYRWDGNTIVCRFGFSVSGAGDVNADGFADLIVGAHWTNVGGVALAGEAFVYSGATGDLLFQPRSEPGQLLLFGASVSGAGDVDQDGYDDVIVGARGYAGHHGYAELFSGASGLLLHQWYGNNISDYYGCSVSAAGDVNADGINDVVIGAYGADSGGISGAGTVDVFTFHPYIFSDTYTVSASAGGTIGIELDFSDAAALKTYKILLSASGIGPSIRGIAIPLTTDVLTVNSFRGIYPPAGSYSNLHGTLDASGNATASITLPAGLSANMVGRVFYFAAIANSPGQLPEYSSVALTVRIVQ